MEITWLLSLVEQRVQQLHSSFLTLYSISLFSNYISDITESLHSYLLTTITCRLCLSASYATVNKHQTHISAPVISVSPPQQIIKGVLGYLRHVACVPLWLGCATSKTDHMN